MDSASNLSTILLDAIGGGSQSSGTFTVEGKEVLMFAAGGENGSFKADPKLLADTWSTYRAEFQQAYVQTPIYLSSDKFATQQKVLDAYLTAASALPMGGSIVATIARYDEAVRNGDTQTQRDIEMMLPVDLIPYATALGKLAAAVKVADKVTDIGGKTNGLTGENAWTLPATERGNVIEQRLAQTEYKDWHNVGQEKNGYFPLVDFQKGDTLVSVKTVDTAGTTWMSRMTEHIESLGNSGATVDGRPATMVLDLRVQPGGAGAAESLKDVGKLNGVVVRITEVMR